MIQASPAWLVVTVLGMASSAHGESPDLAETLVIGEFSREN